MKVNTAQPGEGTATLFRVFEALLSGHARCSRLNLRPQSATNGHGADGQTWDAEYQLDALLDVKRGGAIGQVEVTPDRVFALAGRLIEVGRMLLAGGSIEPPKPARRGLPPGVPQLPPAQPAAVKLETDLRCSECERGPTVEGTKEGDECGWHALWPRTGDCPGRYR